MSIVANSLSSIDSQKSTCVTASPNFLEKGDASGDVSVTHASVTHISDASATISDEFCDYQ